MENSTSLDAQAKGAILLWLVYVPPVLAGFAFVVWLLSRIFA